jgi:DNA uptake protein ComE-like DNA-binding protein
MGKVSGFKFDLARKTRKRFDKRRFPAYLCIRTLWRRAMKGANEHGTRGAASGLVALVFLVLGFQLAIFVVKVMEGPGFRVKPGMTNEVKPEPDQSESRDQHERMTNDAWSVSKPGESDGGQRPIIYPDKSSSRASTRGFKSKYGGYERPVTASSKPARTYESFPFDPNTVSLEDLQRLGLTLRQAESIENYRSKGGRFRSKDDFRKMYVVSDTLFTRLEPFIKIPKVELNAADSAALVSLRGIGPYYAHKILEYRERLGGFLYKAQLLEIEGFDEDRLAGFSDDIEIDTTRCIHLDLWNATESALARHPYLGTKGARSIARYKSLYDTTRWTLADLEHERVLPKENIEKLKKYIEIQ